MLLRLSLCLSPDAHVPIFLKGINLEVELLGQKVCVFFQRVVPSGTLTKSVWVSYCFTSLPTPGTVRLLIFFPVC